MEDLSHFTSKFSKRRLGQYQLGRTIGRGNFALVKLAKHETSKSRVAIKIVNKSKMDQENLKKIYREIQILRSLNHPNIIKLYQIIENETHIFLVTEYASGGEVFEFIQKNNKMKERDARRVFRQIVLAVVYCHCAGVVHRDLKAENLLFSKNFDVKLVDFGFSNYASDDTLLKTWCGSPPYAAPELFLGQSYCGQKADAWSLGVILYILVCGGFPFPSNSLARLRTSVLQGRINIPFYVSAECADLIRKLLVVNPKFRFNVKQIVNHRWFTSSDFDESLSKLLKKSLNSKFGVEEGEEPLNFACLSFMQQRGFSHEKIVEAVKRKLFDDEYACYHLLLRKLKKFDKKSSKFLNLDLGHHSNLNDKNNNNNSLETLTVRNIESNNRRGSRGSITTGKVDVDELIETQLISSFDLAMLGASSSGEDDNHDFVNDSTTTTNSGDSIISDHSETDRSTMDINMNNNNNNAHETFTVSSSNAKLQVYLAQRRHTALGLFRDIAIAQQMNINLATNLGVLPGDFMGVPGVETPIVPYPLLTASAMLTNDQRIIVDQLSNVQDSFTTSSSSSSTLLRRLKPTLNIQKRHLNITSPLTRPLVNTTTINKNNNNASNLFTLFESNNAGCSSSSAATSIGADLFHVSDMNDHYLASEHEKKPVDISTNFWALNLSKRKRHTIHYGAIEHGNASITNRHRHRADPYPRPMTSSISQHSQVGHDVPTSPTYQRNKSRFSTMDITSPMVIDEHQQQQQQQSNLCLAPDILSHLETLYQHALQRPDSPTENVQNLQQEFQQLRATPIGTLSTLYHGCDLSCSSFDDNSLNLNVNTWRSNHQCSPSSNVQDLYVVSERDACQTVDIQMPHGHNIDNKDDDDGNNNGYQSSADHQYDWRLVNGDDDGNTISNVTTISSISIPKPVAPPTIQVSYYVTQ